MSDTTWILGRQTFDGLGRQRSVQVAGRTTHYHYRPAQLPPVANTLADGQRVTYRYEPLLGNALLGTAAEGEAEQQLTYHTTLRIPTGASGGLGSLSWQRTPSGLPLRDGWNVDQVEHSTHWRHSLNGLPVGFIDAAGVEHHRHLDRFGRLQRLEVDGIQTEFSYDALSRPLSITTHDPARARRLTRWISYDTMGREQRSVYTVSDAAGERSITLTLAYSALDQVIQRSVDGAEEYFDYDLRGRLVRYRASPEGAPLDPFGNPIVEQRYILNPLDGYQRVVSTFADGSQDEAEFRYAAHDPTQISTITHTHPSWPAQIELTYDACGRLIADSLGRNLTWNSLDRLVRVEHSGSSCQYHYDASGNLCQRELDSGRVRSFYSAGQLTHEQHGEQRLGLIGEGAGVFALRCKVDGECTTRLIGCDGQGSVRLHADEQLHQHHYSPHGAEPDNDQQVPFGFAGLRREPLTGWYIPAGYRPYDPVLMTFLSPDSDSPFDRGGLNAYAYCAGDPVNRIDPDGHSWVGWTIAGVGLAVGAAAAISTLGAAVPAVVALYGGSALTGSAALAIGNAALNAISLSTGIASMAMQASGADEKAASVLGWISLGTGLASAVIGMAPGSAKVASKALRSPGRANAKRAFASPMTPATRQVQNTAVIYSANGMANDVAMHYNFLGQGIRAFETHGSKAGQLMNGAGQVEDAVRVALREIAPRLAGMADNEPIVLLACYGGKSGAAQRIANVLQRPVHGYDKPIWVHHAGFMQSLEVTSQTSNLPRQQISTWRQLMGHTGPFSAAPDKELATGRLYFPQ